MSEHISRALKLAAAALQYPATKGIPIQCINTPLLRSGGANALALAGDWGPWCVVGCSTPRVGCIHIPLGHPYGWVGQPFWVQKGPRGAWVAGKLTPGEFLHHTPSPLHVVVA